MRFSWFPLLCQPPPIKVNCEIVNLLTIASVAHFEIFVKGSNETWSNLSTAPWGVFNCGLQINVSTR